VTPEGVPYAILPVSGRPLEAILRKRDLSEEQALGLALSGTQALLGLALAGLALPDADPGRFLVIPGEPPQVLLGDMTGCERRPVEAAQAAHRALARAWCQASEAAVRRREGPSPFDDGSASLPDLVRSLAARA
jgi:hypothetical protein